MNERLYLRLDGDPLDAPQTGVPAGTLREFTVHPALRTHVAHIAHYREQIPTGARLQERVLPDGAVHLMFNFGDVPLSQGHDGVAAAAAGPATEPVVLQLHGRIDGVSVTLRPGAAAALLGLPAGEIAGRVVALDELWPGYSGELLGRLAAMPGDAARVALLQRALLQQLQRQAGRASPALRRGLGMPGQALHATRLIAESGGRRPLHEVADAIGVGERRLQQLFRTEVGVTPVAWRRLARLHACLRELRHLGDASAPRWPQLAAEAGFYDQAHLINEFRALCGLSPQRFLEQVRAAPRIAAVSGSSNTPQQQRDRWCQRDHAVRQPHRRRAAMTTPRTPDRPTARPLAHCIAIVTGASRGGGRGIAQELGAAGATVVVTGRSTRQQPAQGYDQLMKLSKLDALPGSIDQTADEVTRAGGRGIALRCDHTRDEEVAALVGRVLREHGRIDLLVNNAWGGHESFDGVFDAPFWQHPLAHWDTMFDRGVRNHLIASRHAAPAMAEAGRGLIVTTTFWDRERYLKGNLYYDLAKAAMARLAFGMAEELRPKGVASVAVSPGWMRTEFVLAGHQADESNWQDKPALARTESPRYLGRAVAALAADPGVIDISGRVLRVGDLARQYGFADIDGRQPPPFEMP